MLETSAALPPLFREQPGDGGAQFRDAGPAARRSDEHIRECRRMRREGGRGVAEAGGKLRRLYLIGLGENDLVAHRGGVERFQYRVIGGGEAAPRIDQQ